MLTETYVLFGIFLADNFVSFYVFLKYKKDLVKFCPGE